MDILTHIERIKEKLHKLRNIDRNCDIFGSQKHNYEFLKPLLEDEIVEIEKQMEVILPNDYRLFLKGVGAGGAGPHYGLLKPLDNEDQRVSYNQEFPFDTDTPLLLMKNDKLIEFDKLLDAAYENGDEAEEDRIWNEKDKLLTEIYNNATKGIKVLNHEGCGMYNILILNGKERGHVWWFNFSDDFGVAPLYHPKTNTPMTFLEWYEIWLDVSISDLENGTNTVFCYGDYVKC